MPVLRSFVIAGLSLAGLASVGGDRAAAQSDLAAGMRPDSGSLTSKPGAAGGFGEAAPLLVEAQGETCREDGSGPVATPVAIDTVPVVVESTVDEYFVLYARSDAHAQPWEIPVAVVRGEAGTTTLAENVEALPLERYRVEKYLIADPADVDGDCVDDITELGDPVSMNPVNSAPSVDLSDGAVSIPDLDMFVGLSRSADRAAIKTLLVDVDSERPGLYFINGDTHIGHQSFMDAVDIERSRIFDDILNDDIVYDPQLVASDGSLGAYYLQTNGTIRISEIERIYAFVAASMPALSDNLYVLVTNSQLNEFQEERLLYEQSRVDLVFEDEVRPDTGFDFLNPGVAYGRLRVMDGDSRPHPRETVIYEALPNELPRVTGIITTARQAPLSHVNLRAIQDGVPNAYIRNLFEHPDIASLVGGFVRYEVADVRWSLRAATPEEVNEYYESSRPAQAQTPQKDLSVTSITALSDVSFEDWTAYGVKAANVAELGRLGFPAGTVPDGFAIPFYFYDEFMKANGFYGRIEQMLADEDFQADFDVQDDMLDDLRDDIEDADSPRWIIDALTEIHATFPDGTSLRYRSSTNNEDLPGFNGAGLYDSKTQDPDETEEDGIDKSLKGVFASLWNFRAFTEREFHRIDHTAAAMGVLVHPNFSDELANGVAVSFDPFEDRAEQYYVNTQLGEDLVTNPEAHSVPEELVLYPQGVYYVLSTSNLVPRGQLLMSAAQLVQLAQHLTTIHDHFKALYDPAASEPFAIEIEFKITAEDILAIKQARPWIFSDATTTTTTTTTIPTTTTTTTTATATTITTGGGWSGGGGGGGGASPAVEISGSALAAADARVTFTAAVTGNIGSRSLSWAAAGPNGFAAQGSGASFAFVAPTGGVYTVTVTAGSGARAPTATTTLTVLDDITGHQFSDEIVWLAEQGITRGCAAYAYCPAGPVTRAQMASLLARALDLETPQQQAGFADVDPAGAHSANIEALHAAQITAGCSQQPLRYCPDDPVTRAQMASFLARALDLEAPQQQAGFADVDPASVHSANIEALHAAQITAGCSQQPLRYCPDDPVTRAQMAAFLYRARHLIAAAGSP